MRITHLNCGWLHKPPLPPACCHCLMIEASGSIVLIDTGIGMHDCKDPNGRIGRDAAEAMGFQFHPSVTAVRQLEERGLDPSRVEHIVLTHCDSDHVGGLSDFPDAQIHLAVEEKQSVEAGHPRYTQAQFSHGPNWQAYSENDCDFFGLPARQVHTLHGIELRLIPLFGHTEGHCGVAVRDGDAWLLHVGDSYYLRDELTNTDHPIDELASFAAVDNALRVQSLDVVRRLTKEHAASLTWLGYHDIGELPADVPQYENVA